jgi:hypothetical protein
MTHRLLPIAFLASLVPFAGGIAAGCGSSSAGAAPAGSDAAAEASPSTGDDAGDAGSAADVLEAAAYPAFVPTDIPQVATRGGPVLSLPKVYPIYYASDDPTFTAQITDFASKVGATSYWNTIASEYGVGSLMAESPIQLTAVDNPPALYTDGDIRAWLAGKLSGADAGDPAFPTPDANTIFAFFFPSGVVISEDETPPDGGADGGDLDAAASSAPLSCSTFGGYHSSIVVGGVNVAYAVIPRCSSFDGFTGIDAVTGAASHELIEAVTDPYPHPDPAYSTTDTAHRYWATVVGGGGEIGDMCAQTLNSFTHFPDLPAYLVQRCWSNKTALTGGDPCVPIPTGDVYFNTIPVMPDILQVTGRGADGGTSTIPTKGVQIAVGASKTIELDLFSNVPTTKDWTVTAYDTNTLAQVTPQLLQFSFDKSSGKNGDKIHMTIKVLSDGGRSTEAFMISSMMGSSETSPQYIWAGVVGN